MKLFQHLKEVVSLLNAFGTNWAVCGGIAASIYRDSPRFTGDIDIAVIDTDQKKAVEIANQVLGSIGYSPVPGFIADPFGKLLPGPALIVGREANPTTYLGVDFLLPIIPWIPDAVVRAQKNRLDYGFARVPTICVEDLCIAKLYALQASPERIVDRDDLIAILRSSKSIDAEYIKLKAAEISVAIPEEFRQLLLL